MIQILSIECSKFARFQEESRFQEISMNFLEHTFVGWFQRMCFTCIRTFNKIIQQIQVSGNFSAASEIPRTYVSLVIWNIECWEFRSEASEKLSQVGLI